MSQGIVKWFDLKKGYGFIRPADPLKEDVFVHISQLQKSGLDSLNQGDEVEYVPYVSQKNKSLSSKVGAKDIKIIKKNTEGVS